MSAGFDESLKLIRVITEVPESERLLKASAIIATDPAVTPARIFIAARMKLTIMNLKLNSING